MKTLLFLLHILLCQWVVTLNDTNRKVGIEKVSDTNGEILLTLTGDKLPFALARIMVNYPNTAVSPLVLSDKTNVKIWTTFCDNTHFAIKASCDRKRSVDPVFSVAREPIKFKVNLGPRSGLGEARHGYQGEKKYEKQPFHGANITKI